MSHIHSILSLDNDVVLLTMQIIANKLAVLDLDPVDVETGRSWDRIARESRIIEYFALAFACSESAFSSISRSNRFSAPSIRTARSFVFAVFY